MIGRKEETRQQTQQREEEAWRLRCTGLSQWQVAERLGLSQAGVSKILSRVGKRLAAEFVADAHAVKARQTEMLERIAAEALGAWQRSKADAETVATVSGRCSKEGERLPDQVTRTVAGQTGNPAHLVAAMKALADVREIWGLNAPAKSDITSAGLPLKAYVNFNPDDV